ncbi:N-glycosylase/DNA lyase, partial [Phenoliferia sp. Uapishka_3]
LPALSPFLSAPTTHLVLELASGDGHHLSKFKEKWPEVTLWASECDQVGVQTLMVNTVFAAETIVELDVVEKDGWKEVEQKLFEKKEAGTVFDLVLAANCLHMMPFSQIRVCRPPSFARATLKPTIVTGDSQAFRWHRFEHVHATRPDVEGDVKMELGVVRGGEEWAMGWGDRTVVLRQDSLGIHYRSLYPLHAPQSIEALSKDLKDDTTGFMLRKYFQLETKLAPLFEKWGADDPHFEKKVGADLERLRGIRVLKQDPWETLISFICSSNNNIGRITLMLDRVSSALGRPLPHPSLFSSSTIQTSISLTSLPPPPASISTGLDSTLALFSFPPVTSFTPHSTDPLLRSLGFGYRAPFIQCTAELLKTLSTESGKTTDGYLKGLEFGTFEGGLEEVREKLIVFKGVGRKVADCVALFGLGWGMVVPVDTHVFQIAIRDYKFPASKTTALTPILHNRVASLLTSLWGPYAGWAQQVLFFADLKTPSTSPKKAKASVKKEPVKAKWEQELELLAQEGGKRKRAKVVKIEYKEESGEEDAGREVLGMDKWARGKSGGGNSAKRVKVEQLE